MRQLWPAAVFLAVGICAVSQEAKPKVSEDSLTSEQIVIYRAVLTEYLKGSDGTLNLSAVTETLDQSDASCVRRMRSYNLTVADTVIHKLEPSLISGTNIILVDPERQGSAIKVNDPQNLMKQNGSHEPMHLTLKQEATRPAGANILQQQAKFDTFVQEFNVERPHEALHMQYPAQVYTESVRPYRGIPDPHYPFHDKTIVVTNCGRLCLYRKKINLSTSLAGQAVGIKEVDDGIWLVSFMNYDLGYIDLEEKTLQPLANPFGPKV